MNFFDHKTLGNHLLQLCHIVVKHPVYDCVEVGGYTHSFVSRTEVCKTGAVRAGHVGRHVVTAYIHGDAVIELHIASSHCVIPAIVIPHAVIPKLNYCRQMSHTWILINICTYNDGNNRL